jgi:hypothetical protein
MQDRAARRQLLREQPRADRLTVGIAALRQRRVVLLCIQVTRAQQHIAEAVVMTGRPGDGDQRAAGDPNPALTAFGVRAHVTAGAPLGDD